MNRLTIYIDISTILLATRFSYYMYTNLILVLLADIYKMFIKLFYYAIKSF